MRRCACNHYANNRSRSGPWKAFIANSLMDDPMRRKETFFFCTHQSYRQCCMIAYSTYENCIRMSCHKHCQRPSSKPLVGPCCLTYKGSLTTAVSLTALVTCEALSLCAHVVSMKQNSAFSQQSLQSYQRNKVVRVRSSGSSSCLASFLNGCCQTQTVGSEGLQRSLLS